MLVFEQIVLYTPSAWSVQAFSHIVADYLMPERERERERERSLANQNLQLDTHAT